MFKKLFKQSTKEEKVYAPINGTIVPLEEVPDPVFNEKMMGEGIAIIPEEGKVSSPVNGKVVQIPETKHAIGLESEGGTEILIHIGLETVSLEGKGFTVNVNVGDSVTVGQPLIDMHLSFIQENAANIITPIVITNSGEGNKNYRFTEKKSAVTGETVMITVLDK